MITARAAVVGADPVTLKMSFHWNCPNPG